MTPQRILAIQVSRIGDTLLATPALRAIATAWPNAQLDVLAHPGRAEILRHLPFLHRVGTITKRTAPWRGWTDAVTGKSYDLAFVWGHDEPLIRYALRTARDVVAFAQRDPTINARLFKCVTPPPFQSAHSVPLSRTLTDALHIAPAGNRLSYHVTPEEKSWAVKQLATDLPAATTLRVGLQVASFPTKAYRDWPIQHFMELCERIRAEQPQAHFLIFGGDQEHERTHALKQRLGAAATLYAGKLTLRQTAALMSQLDIYIGVDTGPTHIMGSFDIPLVGLYHGFSRSELIGPLDHPQFYAVDHPLAGRDCSTEASMADISVDTVMARVREALRAAKSGTPT